MTFEDNGLGDYHKNGPPFKGHQRVTPHSGEGVHYQVELPFTPHASLTLASGDEYYQKQCTINATGKATDVAEEFEPDLWDDKLQDQGAAVDGVCRSHFHAIMLKVEYYSCRLPFHSGRTSAFFFFAFGGQYLYYFAMGNSQLLCNGQRPCFLTMGNA